MERERVLVCTQQARKNSNSKTLFYKDCREREREHLFVHNRQKERERVLCLYRTGRKRASTCLYRRGRKRESQYLFVHSRQSELELQNLILQGL